MTLIGKLIFSITLMNFSQENDQLRETAFTYKKIACCQKSSVEYWANSSKASTWSLQRFSALFSSALLE